VTFYLNALQGKVQIDKKDSFKTLASCTKRFISYNISIRHHIIHMLHMRDVPWDSSKSHRRRFVTCQNMHVILRWLKIRSIEFFLNFGLKYWLRAKIPSWLTFLSSKILRWLIIRRKIKLEAKMIRILSHLRIFDLKKVGQLGILKRDQYFEPKF